MDEPQVPEVPTKDVERIENWLRDLEFEPLLSTLVSGIKRKAIERDVKVLSGEDQSSLKEHQRVSSSAASLSQLGLKRYLFISL